MNNTTEIFRYLDTNKNLMTSGQIRFIDGLKKYEKYKGGLSDKQLIVLFEIESNIRAKATPKQLA
jgi:hypothetical protein